MNKVWWLLFALSGNILIKQTLRETAAICFMIRKWDVMKIKFCAIIQKKII